LRDNVSTSSEENFREHTSSVSPEEMRLNSSISSSNFLAFRISFYTEVCFENTLTKAENTDPVLGQTAFNSYGSNTSKSPPYEHTTTYQPIENHSKNINRIQKMGEGNKYELCGNKIELIYMY
jgi:hypothetical protein